MVFLLLEMAQPRMPLLQHTCRLGLGCQLMHQRTRDRSKDFPLHHVPSPLGQSTPRGPWRITGKYSTPTHITSTGAVDREVFDIYIYIYILPLASFGCLWSAFGFLWANYGLLFAPLGALGFLLDLGPFGLPLGSLWLSLGSPLHHLPPPLAQSTPAGPWRIRVKYSTPTPTPFNSNSKIKSLVNCCNPRARVLGPGSRTPHSGSLTQGPGPRTGCRILSP